MTEPTAPEFMPVLSFGYHQTPKEGACIMEYASFLAGEPFSMTPGCSLRFISEAAWLVNDSSSDEQRQRLLPLLPRLMGTAIWDVDEERRVESALRTWRNAQEWWHGALPAQPETDGKAIEFLTGMLDEYDRLTGRTEVVEVTAEDYRRMAQLTGTP